MKLAETDWLGSEPIFFNVKTRLASRSFWDLATSPVSAQDFSSDALGNYLDFGYSVFGRTPLRDVRFLQANEELWRGSAGSLEVKKKAEPFFNLSQSYKEGEVFELLRQKVRDWEDSLSPDSEIIVPLSGGLDSRLLLWAVRDKERVRTFTYGLSPLQNASYEVRVARAVAERFGVRWSFVPLLDVHQHLDRWYREFGLSTHAHGMYQIEFYAQIRNLVNGPAVVLSGLLGDVWAGSIPHMKISSPDDLRMLGYSHGLHADSHARPQLESGNVLLDEFWKENAEMLRETHIQNLFTGRLKILLLSYLLRVPKMFDFDAWTPFTDSQLAFAMLRIPQHRRKSRLWQYEFLSSQGLMFGFRALGGMRTNTLFLQASRARPLNPLSQQTLEGVIHGDYVAAINQQLLSPNERRLVDLVRALPLGRATLRKLKLNWREEGYVRYMCLYPLERSLRP